MWNQNTSVQQDPQLESRKGWCLLPAKARCNRARIDKFTEKMDKSKLFTAEQSFYTYPKSYLRFCVYLTRLCC